MPETTSGEPVSLSPGSDNPPDQARGLFPTPTRLKLLRGVQRREVTYYVGSEDSYWDGAGNGRKVTAEMDAMLRAGWVDAVPSITEADPWVLTESGRKVLEEADRGD